MSFLTMRETAGVYGPWFEWKRQGESLPTREQLLSLSDQDLALKDIRLYLRRFEYRKECQRIFSGLSVINYAMNNGIGICVNTPAWGDGLILRETFKENNNISWKNKLTLNAFLVTANAVFKIGNLTPKALEKAEKAEVGFRLKRLAMVSDKIRLRDIFLDDKPSDGDLLDSVIRRSIETAKKKVGPQEYIANLASLN